jgi:VanZ family protein
MKLSSFYLAIAAFLVSFILLVLPGNEFPKAKLFNIHGLDKVIHTIMFFTLTWLFCRPLKNSNNSLAKKRRWFLQIAILAILYGILIEFVQKYFVPFRSFELADIAVDALGAMIGYFVSRKMFAVKEMQ